MPATSLPRAVFSGVLAGFVVFLAGCGARQPAAASPSAGGGSVSIGEAPQTEAAAPSEQAQPTEPAPAFPTTARAYAEATVAAWSSGDLAWLGELTTPQVHEQFVEIPGQLKADWIHYRCDGAAGSSYCTLRNGDGDQVRLRVTNQYLGGPHAVVELTASLTTYPANGEAYVSEFVRAWAAENTARMRVLAKPDVVVAVNNNHQDRPQGTWTLSTVGESGGAGLLIVDVDVNEGSVQFTLHVGTTLLGSKHAIVWYEP